MVMVVSVLPGGHPRCVPNKPTCWRDNGSTVTTQLLERVKRVRGEGREAVTTTESIPITGKKQSSLSFNVRETNEAIFVTLFFSIPRDTNGIGRYTRFQIIPARIRSQTPLDFRSTIDPARSIYPILDDSTNSSYARPAILNSHFTTACLRIIAPSSPLSLPFLRSKESFDSLSLSRLQPRRSRSNGDRILEKGGYSIDRKFFLSI